MRLYFILFYFSLFFSLSGMQENGPFELPKYAITVINSTIYDQTQLKQFGKQQVEYQQKKILLINKNEYWSINKKQNIKKKTQSYVSPRLNKYAQAFCFINPKEFNCSSKKIINLLASGNIKTDYFIFNQSDYSAILDNVEESINQIHSQVNTEKFVHLHKKTKISIINQFKQDLYSFITSFSNKIISIPILCLIIKLTDHPDFPWPYWQPFILDGFPFIILLKMLLE